MKQQVVKKHKMAGLTVSENLYPPFLREPVHVHHLASLSFVLAGSYLERCEKQELTRVPATLVFRPPQERHAVQYHNEVRILSVQIDAPRFEYIGERSTGFDAVATFRSEKIARLGHLIYHEFCRMDTAWSLSIEGLVLEIIAEASRAGTDKRLDKSPCWLKDAEEFLHGNFSEPFDLQSLAGVVGVHPVHLARVFRRQKGCTLGEYVRHLRVRFAQGQLSETQNSISNIAAAAGFADHSHLTRTFKEYLGVTPSKYRKLLGKC